MQTTSQTLDVEQGAARTGLVTLVLVGATFLAGLDLFVVNVAFDEIGRDFTSGANPPSLSDLSWILTAYAVVYAALLVPLGRLADRYGRKNAFVLGLSLFAASSLACSLSDGVWVLVAFRAAQAVGAAAMTPASLGLLVAALPPEGRAPAARLWALTGAVAAALGPAFGGLLVELSWQWAFLVNVPISLALVLAAIRFVPDVRHDGAGAPRPDLLGAVVLTVAVGALVLGLVQGNEWGWASAGALTAFGVAAGSLVGFCLLSTWHPSPVIDPALLRIRSFVLANVATLFFNIGFGASLLGGILWMQQAWGYSAVTTGIAVSAGPVAVPVTAFLVAKRFPSARPGMLVVWGSVVAAISGTWMSLTLTEDPSYATTFLPPWLVMGVGVGLAFPNLVAAATATLPADQMSTGSGVVSMARQLGIVLGVSILVSIVGTSIADESTFRPVFWLVAGASLLAAVAARAMASSPGPWRPDRRQPMPSS